jgi:hypothetical protein
MWVITPLVAPVALYTNTVISHEWGENRNVITKKRIYPWSFVTQIFRNGDNHKTFEVMNKDNNNITELRTILQRESQNS